MELPGKGVWRGRREWEDGLGGKGMQYHGSAVLHFHGMLMTAGPAGGHVLGLGQNPCLGRQNNLQFLFKYLFRK